MSNSALYNAHKFMPDMSTLNRAHNPEFMMMQRWTPASLNTVSIASTAFGFDRWRANGSAGNIGMQRVLMSSAGALASTQGTAQYCGYFEKLTANGFYGASQTVESFDSQLLIGQTVSFSILVKAAVALAGTTIRASLVSWTGTADAINVPVSSWASQPTYNTNFTQFATATATMTSTGWTQITCTGTVPAGTNNIVLLFHTTASVTAATGNGFYVTGAQLFVGNDVPMFYPRQRQQEIQICQRFYEKSYDIDTPPGSVTAAAFYTRPSAGDWHLAINLKVTKRALPTAAQYSPVTGASGALRNYDAGVDRAGTPFVYSSQAIGLYTPNATAGQLMGGHWIADCDI